MRRAVLGAVAAVVTAGLGLVPLLVEDDLPLPVLRNDATWRTSSVLGPATLGGRLIDPLAESIWLADGTVPAAGARTRATTQALRDLRGLTQPNGAVAAGPDGPWAYAWPRDSAFVAAAYAETGHVADARRVLGFLSRVQRADGGFEARYRLDGSGPPDDRPRQSDGAGWVLWSLERVRAAGTGRTLPAELRRAAGPGLRLRHGPDGCRHAASGGLTGLLGGLGARGDPRDRGPARGRARGRRCHVRRRGGCAPGRPGESSGPRPAVADPRAVRPRLPAARALRGP